MKIFVLLTVLCSFTACSVSTKKTVSRIEKSKSSLQHHRSSPSKEDLTPLMEAAKLHHVDIMRSMLMKGVDTNEKNSEGRTAIFYSAELGCLECIQLLVRAGAKVNIRDKKGKLPIDYLKDTPQKTEILKLLKS